MTKIKKDGLAIPTIAADGKIIAVPVFTNIKKDNLVIPTIAADGKIIAVRVDKRIKKDNLAIPTIAADGKIVAVSTSALNILLLTFLDENDSIDPNYFKEKMIELRDLAPDAPFYILGHQPTAGINGYEFYDGEPFRVIGSDRDRPAIDVFDYLGIDILDFDYISIIQDISGSTNAQDHNDTIALIVEKAYALNIDVNRVVTPNEDWVGEHVNYLKLLRAFTSGFSESV